MEGSFAKKDDPFRFLDDPFPSMDGSLPSIDDRAASMDDSEAQSARRRPRRLARRLPAPLGTGGEDAAEPADETSARRATQYSAPEESVQILRRRPAICFVGAPQRCPSIASSRRLASGRPALAISGHLLPGRCTQSASPCSPAFTQRCSTLLQTKPALQPPASP